MLKLAELTCPNNRTASGDSEGAQTGPYLAHLSILPTRICLGDVIDFDVLTSIGFIKMPHNNSILTSCTLTVVVDLCFNPPTGHPGYYIT